MCDTFSIDIQYGSKDISIELKIFGTVTVRQSLHLSYCKTRAPDVELIDDYLVADVAGDARCADFL